MVWAIVGISVAALGIAGAGFGFAVKALSLSKQVGNLTTDVAVAAFSRDAALRGARMAEERIDELERIVERRGVELQLLHDEIETCGTDEQRARSAVAGIRLMLPAFAAEETAADHD